MAIVAKLAGVIWSTAVACICLGFLVWFSVLAASHSLEYVNVTRIARPSDAPALPYCEVPIEVASPVDGRQYFVNLRLHCCPSHNGKSGRDIEDVQECYEQVRTELEADPTTVCRRHPAGAIPPVMYKHITEDIDGSLIAALFFSSLFLIFSCCWMVWSCATYVPAPAPTLRPVPASAPPPYETHLPGVPK